MKYFVASSWDVQFVQRYPASAEQNKQPTRFLKRRRNVLLLSTSDNWQGDM